MSASVDCSLFSYCSFCLFYFQLAKNDLQSISGRRLPEWTVELILSVLGKNVSTCPTACQLLQKIQGNAITTFFLTNSSTVLFPCKHWSCWTIYKANLPSPLQLCREEEVGFVGMFCWEG